ncbi:MAG: DEAD/DEAH box helicase [Candidatus Bathyarchaeota archaeon]|nr:DEAD/DEAH box helicase [Candidatus Bathyarchaeota archaeon]
MDISDLVSYNIPETIVSDLEKRGYKKLTRIQESALKTGMFDGRSLVISAPTNTGKTFIAELVIINAAIYRSVSKTFYLLPLKALAEEKFHDFNEKYSEWGLQIAISTGDRSKYDGELENFDVIIATYEKLLTLLIRNPRLINQIGVVIIDEIQNIGDSHRGVNVELLLSMLITEGIEDLQIIALSATTPNASELADWLKADLVTSDFREIELREGIAYIGDADVSFQNYEIKNGDFVFQEHNSKQINVEKQFDVNSFNFIIPLSNDEQIITFEPTRNDAERLAQRLSANMENAENDAYLVEMELTTEPTPTSVRLSRCVRNGVGFHHAGLLANEKSIVENAFSQGDIRIICATTTLAAGVNTPAKNVIMRSHQFWGGDLPLTSYKNMAGRAGRIFQHDDFGRSILFAHNEKELHYLWNKYIIATVAPVESQIPSYGDIGLPLLIILSFFECKEISEILDVIENTFFGYTYSGKDDVIRRAFEEGIRKELLRLNDGNFIELLDDVVTITELGRCCVNELISPMTARLLVEGFTTLQDNIEDYGDLDESIIHLVCNTYDAIRSNSLLYIRNHRDVLKYARVNSDKYLVTINDQNLFLRSVFTTQLVLDWIAGTPYNELRRYGLPSGQIKSRTERISWILRGATALAKCTFFSFDDNFLNFLDNLTEQVLFGVPVDVLNLVRLNLPVVHRTRAISLYDAGLPDIDSLINVSLDDLIKIDGIGNRVATRIKSDIESYILSESDRRYQSQVREAKEVGLDVSLIERLYHEQGDDFVKIFIEILVDHFKLPASYVGDSRPHDVDGIITLDKGIIVIEGKRQKNDKVGPVKAEEVWGKGKKYDPIAYVTIGYPDFSTGSINNVHNTKITLLPHYIIGKMLLDFYQGRISQDDVLGMMMSGTYLGYRKITKQTIT